MPIKTLFVINYVYQGYLHAYLNTYRQDKLTRKYIAKCRYVQTKSIRSESRLRTFVLIIFRGYVCYGHFLVFMGNQIVSAALGNMHESSMQPSLTLLAPGKIYLQHNASFERIFMISNEITLSLELGFKCIEQKSKGSFRLRLKRGSEKCIFTRKWRHIQIT